MRPFHDTPDKDITVLATFGAVHLRVTSLSRAIAFWTNILGMKLRHTANHVAELGSEEKTLVVVHQTATMAYQKGYSGLYHFAIHAPNQAEFAKMLYRVLAHHYPCSPTDHIMSQSVYLNDPDGITIEFALETPERFKRVVTTGGLRMEDAEGNVLSASSGLNIDEVLEHLPDTDLSKGIAATTTIGHIHLYASDVSASDAFYKQLGFTQFNFLPQFLYADVSAGGPYQHRIAMNAWYGLKRPLAPQEQAGLDHYQIIFANKQKLKQALQGIKYEEKEGNYWVNDPTGNMISLTSL